jgi:hypothetical protein
MERLLDAIQHLQKCHGTIAMAGCTGGQFEDCPNAAHKPWILRAFAEDEQRKEQPEDAAEHCEYDDPAFAAYVQRYGAEIVADMPARDYALFRDGYEAAEKRTSQSNSEPPRLGTMMDAAKRAGCFNDYSMRRAFHLGWEARADHALLEKAPEQAFRPISEERFLAALQEYNNNQIAPATRLSNALAVLNK